MTVVHVNIPEGTTLSQSKISELIDKNGRKNLVAFFGDYNLDPADAHQISQDVWGDLNPDTTVWGARKIGPGQLSFKSDVLKEVKRKYDRKFEGTKRALTSLTAALFIPALIAPEVVDIIAKKMPFIAMIQKKRMTSSTMTILVRATDQIANIDFATDSAATLTPITQARTSISVTAKLLFVAGQVSHFLQSAAQETTDVYAKEIEDHFIDMQGFKEKACIAAEKAATGTWAGHFTAANGWDGIIKEIETNASANFTALSAQSINISHLEKISENVAANNGEVAAYICDRSTFTRIRNLAKDFKRYSENDNNLGFPNENFSFDGKPVYPSNFMSRAINEKAVFGFDLEAVQYRELLPDTLFEVAQDMSPSKKFFFEHFGTFVVVAPTQCSAYVNGA